MALEPSRIATAARQLLAEHRERRPYRPLPDGLRSESLEDAYRIQDEYQRLRQGELAGYKIALTSKAMQAMCGVDQPLAGGVFADVVYRSPLSLNLADFQHVGVEFEVAVRLGEDLPAAGSPHTSDSVASAVAACIPSFELVEDRHADYSRMDAFSLIADNCWNGGVVLGDAVERWQDLDLRHGATRLWIDDEPAGQGRVGDALGHPFAAVAWLANLLNQRGRKLERDMLVMTGSSITTKFPQAGQRLRFAIDGLGEVQLALH